MRIINFFTDAVIFEDTSCSSLKELVKKAILRGVSLEGALLDSAHLTGICFNGISLKQARLQGANLNTCDLRYSDLRDVDMTGATLKSSLLCNSMLNDASMRGADLRGAYLDDTYLRGVDLFGANLQGVSLWRCVGNMKEIKSLQVDKYHIAYTSQSLQIGSFRGNLDDWWGIDAQQLISSPEAIESEKSNANLMGLVRWWALNKDFVRDTIERFPANSSSQESLK